MQSAWFTTIGGFGLRESQGRSSVERMAVQTHVSSAQRRWLFSRRADFWLACGGAPVGLLAAMVLIFLHGDREIDAIDFVLSEFHLGATYGAIVQRRLWRGRWNDVLVIPLVIVALTYALSMSGQTIWLTSMAMYAAVWHRGRQSLGVARFYQRGVGGPVSRLHHVLFRGAIYLPMLAATFSYTHLAPAEYEGQPYLALPVGAAVTSMVALAALAWVIAYLAWVLGRTRDKGLPSASRVAGGGIHPGEWWVVVAHAVAFGSAYALGASNASYVLVLAVHHEVQYLYFTYAIARRPVANNEAPATGIDFPTKSPSLNILPNPPGAPRLELKSVAAFMSWPVVGLVGSVLGGWLQLGWLAPLGVGGLFCHYWLDGRIWTQRSLPG